MSAIKASIVHNGQEIDVQLRFRHEREDVVIQESAKLGRKPITQKMLKATTAYITHHVSDTTTVVIGEATVTRHVNDRPNYEDARTFAMQKLFREMGWFKSKQGWENRKAIEAAYESRFPNVIFMELD